MNPYSNSHVTYPTSVAPNWHAFHALRERIDNAAEARAEAERLRGALDEIADLLHKPKPRQGSRIEEVLAICGYALGEDDIPHHVPKKGK